MPNQIYNSIQFLSSVIQGNLREIRARIQEGVDLNRRYDGWTALDFALVDRQQEVAELLRSNAAEATLSNEDIAEIQREKFRKTPLETRIVIKISCDPKYTSDPKYKGRLEGFKPQLEIENYRAESNELISKVFIPHESLRKLGTQYENVKIIDYKGSYCVGVLDPQDNSKLVAVLDVESHPVSSHIMTACSWSTAITIESPYSVAFNGEVELNELVVKARSVLISEKSVIQLNTADIVTHRDVNIYGDLIAEHLKLGGTSLHGKLSSLHTTQSIENHGSLHAKHLELNCKKLVNSIGALIKANDYILPDSVDQTDIKGSFLIGQETSEEQMGRSIIPPSLKGPKFQHNDNLLKIPTRDPITLFTHSSTVDSVLDVMDGRARTLHFGYDSLTNTAHEVRTEEISVVLNGDRLEAVTHFDNGRQQQENISRGPR